MEAKVRYIQQELEQLGVNKKIVIGEEVLHVQPHKGMGKADVK